MNRFGLSHILLGGTVSLVAALGCTDASRSPCVLSPHVEGQDRIGASELVSRMAQIRPWGQADSWTPADWRTLEEVAACVQKMPPHTVRNAIQEYLCAEPPPGEFHVEAEIRVLLLLRTVFELPERAPVEERKIYIGLSNRPEPEDGMVNLSWPISWSTGKPRLVASSEGFRGPYLGEDEYCYFLCKYPYRDLHIPEAPH